MSTNIGTEEHPVWVFVEVTAEGFVDAMVRAPDRATFDAAARAAELVVADAGNGGDRLSAGVEMDHLDAVTLVHATLDAAGNEIAPPVIDPRHHVNIRMAPPSTVQVDETGTLKWHKWAVAWTMNGSPDTDRNASEDARVLMGVSLIDPDTISSPSRVWL